MEARTAIVTGGAKRIGAELVRALAADGWHVLIHYHRSRAEAEALAAEVGNASTVQADLADPAAAETILAAPTACRRRACWSTTPRSSPMTTSAISPPRAGPPISTSICARRPCSPAPSPRAPGEGLIVNMLDAKLAAPNPDFFSYTDLQDRPRRPHRAGRARLRARRSASAASRRRSPWSPARRAAPISTRSTASTRSAAASTSPRSSAALRFIIATPSMTGHTILLDGGQRFLSLPRDVQFLEPE